MAEVQGYLKVYRDDGFRHHLKTFNYYGDNHDFVHWADEVEDEISSFHYKLPPGVQVTLYEDDNMGEGSRNKTWRGTGYEEGVDEEEMPGYISDDGSGHRFTLVDG